jgi:hypothetical protein
MPEFSIKTLEKKLPSTFRKNPLIWAGGGLLAVGAGLFAYFNRQNTTSNDAYTLASYEPAPEEASEENAGVDLTGLDTFLESLMDSIDASNENFANLAIATNQALKRQSYDDVTSEPTVTITEITSPLYGYGPAQTLEAEIANETRLNSDLTFVSDEIKRTGEVITARQTAGMDTSVQEGYMVRLMTGGYDENLMLSKNSDGKIVVTPKTGFGSAKTKEAETSNEAKLNSNKSFVSSEIDRTNKVIANRQKAGMDTSEQTGYLKRLKTGSY